MFQKILQWFTNRGSKKPSGESEWSPTIETPDEPVSTEQIPSIPAVEKAKAKRERRKARNIKYNNKTKGAFGKPKVMRRERE